MHYRFINNPIDHSSEYHQASGAPVQEGQHSMPFIIF